MTSPEVERLIGQLARLPGLGPRSARRAVLHLIARRETLLEPLARAIGAVASSVRTCSVCGNVDTRDPCTICSDPEREAGMLCVVEGIGELWALERTGGFRGRYHVLGGTLSAVQGVGPEQIGIDRLLRRVADESVREVILATNLTVDGQTTAHYLAERLESTGVGVSRLAHGVPMGGAIDYLDDGTLIAALRARRPA